MKAMHCLQLKFVKSLLILVVCLVPLHSSLKLNACTRLVYKGDNGLVLTGRSMDFSIEIPANQWIFPRGMHRNGEVGKNSIEWTSKYGSLAVSAWDISTVDGMNEKGLVANLLWLVQSQYPEFKKDGSTKGLAISLWAQYVLDNFASVSEAVEHFEQATFAIVSDFIPGTDKFTTVHLSISDSSGDNAIFEYINGQLVIHHHPDYRVMTNDPPYLEQLAIHKYWANIPGKYFLPGSVTSSDRFARASFFLDAIPKTDNTRVAVASVMSIVRNVSVPYGFEIEGYPNLSTTRWRCVADHKNLFYYFETALTPNAFWVDLNKLDFDANASVRMLDLANNNTYNGESSPHFKSTKPFKFLGL
jgi:penicillin V acylase-like amidase (Ntn superfamily)